MLDSAFFKVLIPNMSKLSLERQQPCANPDQSRNADYFKTLDCSVELQDPFLRDQHSIQAVKAGQAERQGRAILTDDQARAIFKCKPSSISNDRCKVALLAKMYGVSAKTVRDIWVGRTWYWATYSLDLTKPISTERLQRKLGRPRGAKDSKPRSRKLHPDSEEIEKSAPAVCRSSAIKKDQKCLTVKTGASHGGCLASSSSIVRWPIPSDDKGFALSSADIISSNPPTVALAAKAVPASAQTWHEALIHDSTSTEFVDPFHNDWPFWPKEKDTPC